MVLYLYPIAMYGATYELVPSVMKKRKYPTCSGKLNRKKRAFHVSEVAYPLKDMVGKGPGSGSCGVSQLKDT